MIRLKIPDCFFSAILVLLLTVLLSIPPLNADAQTSSSEKQQVSKKKPVSTPKTVTVIKNHNVKKVKHKVSRKTSSARKTTSSHKKKSSTKTTAKAKSSTKTTAKAKSFSETISAKSAIIIDARSGETLFAKAPDNPRQPASTIKILTGMIALKSLSGSEQVSVSPWAAGQPSSKIHINPEKQYQANDLINAVLLASANDASVALAERISGSETSFANLMTEKARLWGAQNTTCKTATGLTAKGQTSTARDLAVMFRHAMEDPTFAQRMKQVKVQTTFGTLLRNHNKALWQVEGTQGGKTGYTNAARQTYVGKFKRGDKEIVVAVMGSETMWNDIKMLVKRGFSLQGTPATASDSLAVENQGIVAQTSGTNISGKRN